MMNGDSGRFVADLYGQIQDGLSALLTVDQLLGGVAPDKLAKMQADAAEASKLPAVLSKNGFLLAAEVRSVDGPEWQVTLILPDAGPKAEALFATLRLTAALNKLPVKDAKTEGLAVSSINAGQVYATWWRGRRPRGRRPRIGQARRLGEAHARPGRRPGRQPAFQAP